MDLPKIRAKDLHSGYLMGEIFAKLYPHEVDLMRFIDCYSMEVKLENWKVLKEVMDKKGMDIPSHAIEGTIHCKEGAANFVLEYLYCFITKRKLKKPPPTKVDLTDLGYQVLLPLHARSTASTSVKTNFRNTEDIQDKSITVRAKKAEDIIQIHNDQRRLQRLENPKRFGIRPTLAQRCPRHAPTSKPDDNVVVVKNGASKAQLDAMFN